MYYYSKKWGEWSTTVHLKDFDIKYLILLKTLHEFNRYIESKFSMKLKTYFELYYNNSLRSKIKPLEKVLKSI